MINKVCIDHTQSFVFFVKPMIKRFKTAVLNRKYQAEWTKNQN